MNYTRLTLAQFKALYPAFDTLTQEQYDIYVARAEKRVKDCLGDYYQEGVELLTAHLLMLNSVGTSNPSGFLASSGATSFKSGAFTASISEAVAQQRSNGDFNATPYGQQYALLLRQECGGPRLYGRSECC